MKLKCNKINSCASTLVVAMLVCLAGSIGMYSLVVLISARGFHVELSNNALQRRLSNLSAKAIAKKYIYSMSLVSGNASEATLKLDTMVHTTESAKDWPSVVIPDFSAPLASLQEFSVKNPFGPGSNEGFTVDANVSLKYRENDATDLLASARNCMFRLKSRSTLLGGSLLQVHKPIISPSTIPYLHGHIIVVGHTHFHVPVLLNWNTATGFQTGTLDAPDDFSGGSVSAGNFPKVLRSGGIGADGTVQLHGEANYIDNAATQINSLYHKLKQTGADLTVSGTSPLSIAGVACCDEAGTGSAGTGIVTINLNNHTLPPVLLGNGVTKIRLLGQINSSELSTANNLPPAFILALQDTTSTPLVEILLHGDNNRRTVIGVKRSAIASAVQITHSTGVSSQWRLAAFFENTPINISLNSGSSLDIKGGIETDSHINVSTSNTLRLSQETDPELLERICTREAWVETYMQ